MLRGRTVGSESKLSLKVRWVTFGGSGGKSNFGGKTTRVRDGGHVPAMLPVKFGPR
jgi:hypothetical protein